MKGRECIISTSGVVPLVFPLCVCVHLYLNLRRLVPAGDRPGAEPAGGKRFRHHAGDLCGFLQLGWLRVNGPHGACTQQPTTTGLLLLWPCSGPRGCTGGCIRMRHHMPKRVVGALRWQWLHACVQHLVRGLAASPTPGTTSPHRPSMLADGSEEVEILQHVCSTGRSRVGPCQSCVHCRSRGAADREAGARHISAGHPELLLGYKRQSVRHLSLTCPCIVLSASWYGMRLCGVVCTVHAHKPCVCACVCVLCVCVCCL